MAKLSRNARLKARKKRTISQQGRQIRALQTQLFNTSLTLLAVLSQRGGEITITQGTLQQVLQQLQKLNWQSKPGPAEGEFTIQLITKEETDVAESLPTADDSDQKAGEPTGASSAGPDIAAADVASDSLSGDATQLVNAIAGANA